MQQDSHHNGGHPHPHPPLPSYEHSPDHEHPHPVDREAEGGDSPPNTPGTPTSGTPPFLRPPTAGGRAQSDNQCVGRLQLGGGGMVDHYDMQSPLSPTRPKSPWGRFDPYDFPEVNFRSGGPCRDQRQHYGQHGLGYQFSSPHSMCFSLRGALAAGSGHFQ